MRPCITKLWPLTRADMSSSATPAIRLALRTCQLGATPLMEGRRRVIGLVPAGHSADVVRHRGPLSGGGARPRAGPAASGKTIDESRSGNEKLRTDRPGARNTSAGDTCQPIAGDPEQIADNPGQEQRVTPGDAQHRKAPRRRASTSARPLSGRARPRRRAHNRRQRVVVPLTAACQEVRARRQDREALRHSQDEVDLRAHRSAGARTGRMARPTAASATPHRPISSTPVMRAAAGGLRPRWRYTNG